MAANTLMHTDFVFAGQTNKYTGKVREVYTLADDTLIMIATDRLSAFDVVMPRGIPFKGQILNQIATQMMKSTADLVPNWILSTLQTGQLVLFGDFWGYPTHIWKFLTIYSKLNA